MLVMLGLLGGAAVARVCRDQPSAWMIENGVTCERVKETDQCGGTSPWLNNCWKTCGICKEVCEDQPSEWMKENGVTCEMVKADEQCGSTSAWLNNCWRTCGICTDDEDSGEVEVKVATTQVKIAACSEHTDKRSCKSSKRITRGQFNCGWIDDEQTCYAIKDLKKCRSIRPKGKRSCLAHIGCKWNGSKCGGGYGRLRSASRWRVGGEDRENGL